MEQLDLYNSFLVTNSNSSNSCSLSVSHSICVNSDTRRFPTLFMKLLTRNNHHQSHVLIEGSVHKPFPPEPLGKIDAGQGEGSTGEAEEEREPAEGEHCVRGYHVFTVPYIPGFPGLYGVEHCLEQIIEIIEKLLL